MEKPEGKPIVGRPTNYPDTSKAEQHSFILTMKAFPPSILCVVVLCHTGKIDMGLMLMLRIFLKMLSSARCFRIYSYEEVTAK